jgi:transposase-like protein
VRDIAEVVSITSVFPQTVVETCIVHLIRNSLVASARITKALLIPMFRMQFDDLAFLGGRRAFHPSDVGIHLIFGIEY